MLRSLALFAILCIFVSCKKSHQPGLWVAEEVTPGLSGDPVVVSKLILSIKDNGTVEFFSEGQMPYSFSKTSGTILAITNIEAKSPDGKIHTIKFLGASELKFKIEGEEDSVVFEYVPGEQ